MQNGGSSGFANMHLRLSFSGFEIHQSPAKKKRFLRALAFDSHAAFGTVAYDPGRLGYLQLDSTVKASHQSRLLKGKERLWALETQAER